MTEYIILVIAIAAIIVFSLIKNTRPKPKKQSKSEFYNEQKERVSQGGYTKQALLNKTEKIARKAIWKAIYDSDRNKQLVLFAQVSMGEIIAHQNKSLYMDINSKRVDFVITNSEFIPLFIIEVQGQGHYAQHATKRDIIKREASESAGINYIGIAVGHSDDEIYKSVYEKIKESISSQS